jgi:hypothetical protein
MTLCVYFCNMSEGQAQKLNGLSQDIPEQKENKEHE